MTNCYFFKLNFREDRCRYIKKNTQILVLVFETDFKMEDYKMKQSQHIRKIIVILHFVFLGFMNSSAQQNTDASGGTASGAGGTATYSIGQMDYVTATGTGGSISEGLQHPYKISILSGIEDTDINLVFSVYPNPTTDFVVLSVQNANIQNMTYQLFDVQGKLIEKQKLSGSETLISMTDLANDIYFIKVLNKTRELKVFKVIKN